MSTLNRLSFLEPNAVWEYFEAISAIPRPSKREERIVQYMIDFGHSLGLETSKDAIGNVIIRKPATVGKESRPIVVLQGHLDMVHTKSMTSLFDFDTQGIELQIEGDWVTANETTLGADNGIGVAMIMAVLSSSSTEHPPIEALFTVDEEVGMSGAMAIKADQLNGRIMLNLDSENDTEITVGCTGGVDVKIQGRFEVQKKFKNSTYRQLSISNLSGGHSGVDIHKNLANAIQLFASFLQEISKDMDVLLVSMEGGLLTNVIPNYCTGIIAIETCQLKSFESKIEAFTSIIKQNYQKTDADLIVSTKVIEGDLLHADTDTTKSIYSKILKMPNGVCQWSLEGEHIVETSNNLATVRFGDGNYILQTHVRSFINSERDRVVDEISVIFKNNEVETSGSYPGWKPRFDSDLLSTAKKVYQKVFGTKAKVIAIHAGLECGIFAEIYPEMEMISIGPNTFGAHSPDERVQISSVQKSWHFLLKLLKNI